MKVESGDEDRLRKVEIEHAKLLDLIFKDMTSFGDLFGLEIKHHDMIGELPKFSNTYY